MAVEARWPKITRCSQESLEGYKDTHIDRLYDELLIEILLRLPNCKYVVQCKCVSKRWAALVSHPYFMGQFISLKLGYLNKGLDLKEEHSFAFMMRFYPDRYRRKEHESESFFFPSIFDVQNSSFSPFHSCLGDNNTIVSARVYASYKNLLLSCKHEREKRKYVCCISNVQTRQSILLPSSPYSLGGVYVVGFICDALLNDSYHYSVIFVQCRLTPSTKTNAQIFSSHFNSQWCNKVLLLPKLCMTVGLAYPASSICFDGKLHFSCFEGLFGFDHKKLAFDEEEIQCQLVEWPGGMIRRDFVMGVSQENLHVSDYCCETFTLRVWVLKDYKDGKGNWMSQHRIETREWVSPDSRMAKKFRKVAYHHFVLGFHPRCSDVIYVVIPGCICLCKLSTKTVELACVIPFGKRLKYHLSRFSAFPLFLLKSLPTPLPPSDLSL